MAGSAEPERTAEDAEDLRRMIERLPELIVLADAMGMRAARDLLIDAERMAQRRLGNLSSARLH